jgi:peptide/nickel transport system substrate-binding protein
LRQEKAKKGGHLRVGLEWEVDIIDPPSSFGGWNTGRVVQQMFESLVEDDLENETVPYTKINPALAKNYEVSPDGTEYTFYLRENVKFHDGTPLNAEVVKFNLERIWKEDAPHYYPVAADLNQTIAKVLKEIKIVDSHIVKLILKEPFSEFLRYMTQEDGPGAIVFVSPDAIKKYGNEGVADKAPGTGPFMLKERFETEFGSAVTLEKNPNYWGGTPYLDAITFLPIPDSMDRVTYLETGKVDLVYGPNSLKIEELKNKEFIVKEGPIPYLWYFSFNTREKPFNDVRVRKAIAYAFDRKGLSQEVFAGNTSAASGILPPASPSYEIDFPEYYPYDPKKAIELLIEAGYPDGFEFKLMTCKEGSAQLVPAEICEWLKKDLSKVGIHLEILYSDDWVSYCNEWKLGIPENVGASQMSWGMSCDYWLEYITHSKNISPKGFNVGYYSNQEIDRLLEIARTEIRDERRIELYRIIHRLIMKDIPVLPVANIKAGAVVHHKRIKNFKYPPQNWHDFSRVWIESI